MAGTEYEPISVVVDNVGQVLNLSTVMTTLWRNTHIIDSMSYRVMPTFDSHGSFGTGNIGSWPEGTFRLARYRVRWPAACTAIRVEGWAGNVGSERIKVFITGIGGSAADLAASGTWGATISLSAAIGSIIVIEIIIQGTRPANAWYHVGGVWAGSLAPTDTWPGVPTVTTQFARSDNLIQLNNALDWLRRRMGIAPRVAQRGSRYINGPFKSVAREANHGDYPLYDGTVLRSYSQDILRIYGQVVNQTSPGLRYNVYLNGALAATAPTYGVGTSLLSLPISLDSPVSVSVGTRARVSIRGEVVDAGPDAPWRQSKWSFAYIGTEPNASGYPYATMPPAFTDAPTSATVLRDRLNALVTIAQAVKTRIDATPNVWSIAPAMRDWYGFDDDTRGVNDIRARPYLLGRGQRLIVTGRQVTAKWGVISVPSDNPDERDPWSKYDLSESQSVVKAETTTTETTYLDTIKDFPPGSLYELWGNVEYAAEYDA